MNTPLRDDLIEIIWSIDAKFDDNRTYNADYYADQILNLIASKLIAEAGTYWRLSLNFEDPIPIEAIPLNSVKSILKGGTGQ